MIDNEDIATVKNSSNMSQIYTIDQFRLDYPNEDVCLDKIFRNNIKADFCCPKCQNQNQFRRVKGRRCYACPTCNYQHYPTKGTIFEKSTTPLTLWFYALSACELERQIGVNYKTAWRILMKIRELSREPDEIFDGIIELDETFIGGKNKNRHYNKRVNYAKDGMIDKSIVFGMYQRNGKVDAFVVEDRKERTLCPLVYCKIKKDATVFTDELTSYSTLSQRYNHHSIDHSKGQYGNGVIGTNGIENLWSVLKRTLKGSYISVTKPYLQRYVDEVVFRYNYKNQEVFYELVNRI